MRHATQRFRNGLRLVTITGLSTNAVTIAAYIRGGFRFDPENRYGLSHFTEHIIFNAANNFPRFNNLVQTVEKSGGWRSAFTWIEHQEHVTHLPKDYFKEGLELTLGTIFEPLVTNKEIKKEIGVVKEEILRNKADPSRAIWDYAWLPLFFQGTNLARPYSGTADDIEKITKPDIKLFTSNYFFPENAVIFVAGNLDQDYIKETVDKFSKDYKNSLDRIKQTLLVPKAKKHVYVHNDSSYYQTSLDIGIRTVPFSSSSKYIFDIIREMLAGYFGTQLIQRLRDEGGLIYTWDSFQDNLSDVGYLIFNVTVAHEKVIRVASIIIQEFKRILNGKFKDEEIEMAKGHLIGSILANTETGRDYIRWYGLQELLNPKCVLSVKKQVDLYKGIKNDEIRDIASKYFTLDNIYVAAIGKADENSLLELI